MTPDATPGNSGTGGRGRLAWMLAGVVAIVAVAGVVVVLTGDDGSDTPTAAEEVDGDDPATTPTTDSDAGPPAGSEPEVTDAPADSTSELTPVDVAEGFFGAVSDGDCQGIIDRMTVESFSTDGQTSAQAVAECEADEEGLSAIMSAESWEVEPLTEDGDRAVVSVTLVVDGNETVRELPLERVDGAWKMDLDPTAVAPAT